MSSTGCRDPGVAQKQRGDYSKRRFSSLKWGQPGLLDSSKRSSGIKKKLALNHPTFGFGVNTAHVYGHVVLGASAHAASTNPSSIHSCVKYMVKPAGRLVLTFPCLQTRSFKPLQATQYS